MRATTQRRSTEKFSDNLLDKAPTQRGYVVVVRHDKIEGGTKRLALTPLLSRSTGVEYVYATSAYGYATEALHDTFRHQGDTRRIYLKLLLLLPRASGCPALEPVEVFGLDSPVPPHPLSGQLAALYESANPPGDYLQYLGCFSGGEVAHCSSYR